MFKLQRGRAVRGVDAVGRIIFAWRQVGVGRRQDGFPNNPEANKYLKPTFRKGWAPS